LPHAFAMGEGEMSCELEAIAREEMRHLDWLAETIVELGGTPNYKQRQRIKALYAAFVESSKKQSLLSGTLFLFNYSL